MIRKALVLSLLTTTVQAADIKDWETVFEQDAWRLDVNVWDDGSLSCETRSMADNGTLFSVESWQDGSFSISAWNEDWRFPDEEVDETFVIRIDNDVPWDITGSKSGSTVYSYLDRTEPSTQKFLTAFYNGTSMSVENARGAVIATYPLSGSGAAMEEHAKCEDRIGEASAAIPADPSAKLTKETF